MKYLFYILLILTSFSSFGQKTITALIANSVNNKPISDANIYIKNTSIGTITNEDGVFKLKTAKNNVNDTLVISSIGYKSLIFKINTINESNTFYLEPIVEELDEVVLYGKPLNGNEIVQKAFEKYNDNFPDKPYLSKGFLRHSERNKNEYKWLIEGAITVYDNSAKHENTLIKVNIDKQRRSYDNRNVDSLFLYFNYLSDKTDKNGVFKNRRKRKIIDTLTVKEIQKGINYNDTKNNGLFKIFNGHKNIVWNKNNFDNRNQHIIRNYGNKNSMLDENIFKKHLFKLDTILYEDDKLVYKIKISPHLKMINLNNVIKKHYAPIGWIYIYKDNYAIKEIQYTLVARSKDAKLRNKILYDSPLHYSVKIKFKEYQGKMYMQFFSCITPKLLNTGIRRNLDDNQVDKIEASDSFYYSKQEILFNEIIIDKNQVDSRLNKSWNDNLFKKSSSYNHTFWENYNILLESEEQKKMINDLEKKASLKEQFKNN